MIIDDATQFSLILNSKINEAFRVHHRLHKAYTLCFQPIGKKLDDADIQAKVTALIENQNELIAVIAEETIKLIGSK
jgi:hypothetical protein